MPARGTNAKLNVTNIIKEAFGGNYLGADSGKLYVKADDGGEMVKIAITLTCPKDQIVEEAPSAFDTSSNEATIKELMEKFKL